jgi:DNA-binding NtrC family response regulator
MDKQVIVIVEDEPDIVESLRLMLASYDVISAASLREALEIFKAVEPDAVILDLGLPDSASKKDTLAQVEAATGAPVIVYTGNLDDIAAGRATTRAHVKGGPADLLLAEIKEAAVMHRISKIYDPYQSHLELAKSIVNGMEDTIQQSRSGEWRFGKKR